MARDTIFTISIWVLSISTVAAAQDEIAVAPETVTIGALLSLETAVGKMAQAAIEIAAEDINANSSLLNSTNFLVDIRNSTTDAVTGAFAALELMRNETVGLIGPHYSEVTDFVATLADTARVPLLTFASSSPSLSMQRHPYFIRLSLSDAVFMNAIAHLVNHFHWRDAVLVYVDDYFGKGSIPSLYEALRDKNSRLNSFFPVPPVPDRSSVNETLLKIKNQKYRVIIVNIRADTAEQFFSIAKELGMINDNYVWIVSNPVASLINSFDKKVLDNMEGVFGVRTTISGKRASAIRDFSSRLKARLEDQNLSPFQNPDINIYVLLAYDATWTFAKALDRVIGSGYLSGFVNGNFSSDSFDVGRFRGGKQLKREILDVHFEGLSGQIRFSENGEPLEETLDIIRVVEGEATVIESWDGDGRLAFKVEDVLASPGGTPPGWQIILDPMKKLRIGVPSNQKYRDMPCMHRECRPSIAPCECPASAFSSDSDNGTYSKFPVKVFTEALRNLTYNLSCEFIPHNDGIVTDDYYDDLVDQLALGKYDAVVGDVTPLANLSKYVDFTLPFKEGTIVMIESLDEPKSRPWMFLQPFQRAMWLTTLAFFFFMGGTVWVLERKWNPHFRGRITTQITTMFWFSFSTMFFTHREEIVSKLTRAVLIIWLFVVMVLVSSYTASLSSILTEQRFQADVDDLQAVISKQRSIGYRQGSFVKAYLQQRYGVNSSLLKPYISEKEYIDALKKKEVAAILEDVHVANIVLASLDCKRYRTVGKTFRASDLAFAFPKGSPLASDVSMAVLKLLDSSSMAELRKSLPAEKVCYATALYSQLTIRDFFVVFALTGVVSLLAVLYHFLGLSFKNTDNVSA